MASISCPEIASRLRRSVCARCFFPGDDIDKRKGDTSEVVVKLPLRIDDELARRIEEACALAHVGIIQIEPANREVEGLRRRIGVGFSRLNWPAGDKRDLPPGWRRNRLDEGDVIAGRSRNREMAHRFQFGKRSSQSSIMTFFECLGENLQYFGGGVVINDQRNGDRLAGELGGGLDGLIVRPATEGRNAARCQRACQQQGCDSEVAGRVEAARESFHLAALRGLSIRLTRWRLELCGGFLRVGLGDLYEFIEEAAV